MSDRRALARTCLAPLIADGLDPAADFQFMRS